MEHNYYEDNDLCEICYANKEPYDDLSTHDIYWLNIHCIELRKNRESRKNKNIKSKETFF